jgi:hypothetical protein
MAPQLGDWPSDTKGSCGYMECVVADSLKAVILQLGGLMRVEQLLAIKKKSFY